VSGRFVLDVTLNALRVGGTVPVYGNIFLIERNPPVPTPEPATVSLLGIGLAGVGALLRKRRKRSS
jgi:hypothetical protein